MAINHLLREAILCAKPSPRYAYLSPSYRQSKSIAWDYLKQFAAPIPKVKFHETELRADLPNGARLMLLGAENAESLRGIYLDGCIIDETGSVGETVFPEVIRPALSDRNDKSGKTFCYFFGTPRGHNYFYDLFELANQSEEWHTAVYKASETEIVAEEELQAAQTMMTGDQYEQEFECSWVANIPGSIYGKDLEKALTEKRITKVPYDPALKVDTFWDLGIGDSTAIWFTQSHGSAIHVIDCFEARNEGLPFYCRVLQKKNYLYGEHYAPHDIEVRELGSGKSRREVAWDLGLNFRVVPKLPLEDGIHAAQMIISRCWFDAEKCKTGLDALRHYHRAYNEKLRAYRTSPVHDFSSHFADAFRYMAVGLKEKTAWQPPMQRNAASNYNPLEFRGEI